jgi:hypothetical protein
VQLLRRDLSAGDERGFLANVHSELQELAALLKNGQYTIAGQVPPNSDVLTRVQTWLSVHKLVTIADSPRV